MKHTPGPWKFDPDTAVISPSEGGPGIAQLWSHQPIFSNARLIAQAPTMFELLESTLIALENGCESESDKQGLILSIQETLASIRGSK